MNVLVRGADLWPFIFSLAVASFSPGVYLLNWAAACLAKCPGVTRQQQTMSGQQSRPPQSLLARAKTTRPHREPSDADAARSRPSHWFYTCSSSVADTLAFQYWNLAWQPPTEGVFLSLKRKCTTLQHSDLLLLSFFFWERTNNRYCSKVQPKMAEEGRKCKKRA